MELRAVERLAAQEFRTWGLDEQGWAFGFDNAQKRFGVCKHDTKSITLSRVLVRLNDEGTALDTLRHEVAHALAGSGAGHGLAWVAQCRRVGCKPERCVLSSEIVAAPAPWYLVCEACDYRSPMCRRPKRKYSHTRCGRRMVLTAA